MHFHRRRRKLARAVPWLALIVAQALGARASAEEATSYYGNARSLFDDARFDDALAKLEANPPGASTPVRQRMQYRELRAEILTAVLRPADALVALAQLASLSESSGLRAELFGTVASLYDCAATFVHSSSPNELEARLATKLGVRASGLNAELQRQLNDTGDGWRCPFEPSIGMNAPPVSAASTAEERPKDGGVHWGTWAAAGTGAAAIIAATALFIVADGTADERAATPSVVEWNALGRRHDRETAAAYVCIGVSAVAVAAAVATHLLTDSTSSLALLRTGGTGQAAAAWRF